MAKTDPKARSADLERLWLRTQIPTTTSNTMIIPGMMMVGGNIFVEMAVMTKRIAIKVKITKASLLK